MIPRMDWRVREKDTKPVFPQIAGFEFDVTGASRHKAEAGPNRIAIFETPGPTIEYSVGHS